jgi:hypothetical protein
MRRRDASRLSDVNIVVKAAVRQVQNQADTVKQLATHPVKTVTGIPRGIAHLFGGYKAQAGEVVDGLQTSGHDSSGSTASRASGWPEGYGFAIAVVGE